MTMFDYYDSLIPDYYDSMYLDGYSPYEILEAKKRQLEAQAIDRDEEEQFSKIIVEVKTK